MKKFLRIAFFVVSGILIPFMSLQAQDVNYSQFFSTPIYYNPAFTGINTGLRIRSIYLNEYPSLPISYKDFSFSADFGERALLGFSGVGLFVNTNNEGIGFINDLSFGLSLGFRIAFSKNVFFNLGGKGSVVIKSINWDDFVFSDQLSEKYGNIYQSSFVPPTANKLVFPDFGAGGLLQFANPEGNMTGVAGFAVDHVFQPNESFLSTATAPLPRKYIVHADFVFAIGGQSCFEYVSKGMNDPFKLNPGILFQSQNNINLVQIGMNMQKFNFTLGGWYKTSTGSYQPTAWVLMVGYRILYGKANCIDIMFSHDFQTGTYSGLGGQTEISFILGFGNLQLFGSGNNGNHPEKAIEIDPNDAGAYNSRGIGKINIQDYRGAIVDFNKAIEIDPKYAMAYYNRGKAKNFLGDETGAIADATQAIELNPKNEEVYFFRGNRKAEIRDNSGAIIDFNKAIELKPNYEEAYNSRGTAKKELQDYKGAIVDLTQAIELNPQDWQAYCIRGSAKEELQDYRGAIADYTKVLESNPKSESDPKNAILYLIRGQAEIKIGQKENACLDFSKAGELGNEQAYEAIKKYCQ